MLGRSRGSSGTGSGRDGKAGGAAVRDDETVRAGGVCNEEEEEEEAEEAMRELEAFERKYGQERTWEELQEDASGRLIPLDIAGQQREQRQRQQEVARLGKERVRKGIIRYLVLVVDLSRAAGEMDLRPSRMAVVASCVERFIADFFDQNPLSHMALAVLRHGVAVCLTETSASPDTHVAALRANLHCAGTASIQNALELGCELLSSVPAYGHRELLLVYSALATCDAGNVFHAMQRCSEQHIRCSVVGVAAELYVCRQLCDRTGGRYAVATDEAHLQTILCEHAPPPPVPPERSAASLVRMGFPQRSSESAAAAGGEVGGDGAGGAAAAAAVASLCACHMALQMGATFVCPQCKARICDLPMECRVCGLTLVSSPHLARSYHHLFPVPPFAEVPLPAHPATAFSPSPSSSAAAIASKARPVLAVGATAGKPRSEPSSGTSTLATFMPPTCFGCLCPLPICAKEGTGVRLQCTGCCHHFCFDCDAFIHNSLHNCPGCEAGSSAAALPHAGADCADGLQIA